MPLPTRRSPGPIALAAALALAPLAGHAQEKRIEYPRPGPGPIEAIMAEEPPPTPPPVEMWRLVPGIELSLSATDNPTGASRIPEYEWDIFGVVSPSLELRGVRPNLRLFVDYSLDAIGYLTHHEQSDISHRLTHAADAELVRDLLFLDTRAVINRQIIDITGPIPAIQAFAETNTTLIAAHSISPHLRTRLAEDFAEAELRYTFGQVVSFDEAVADAIAHRGTATLADGDVFGALHWELEADASRVEVEDGGPLADRTIETRLAQATVGWDFNRYFSLIGSYGYERIDDPTLSGEIDGQIWSAGAEWRPGSRSRLRVAYNHRYDRNFWSGEAEWIVSPITRLSAAHTQSIQTTQLLALDQISRIALDQVGNPVDVADLPLLRDEFGRLINPLTNELVLDLSELAFSLRDVAFLRERSELRAAWVRGRDELRTVLFREEREGEDIRFEETAYGASARWLREINPLLRSIATLRYRHVEVDRAIDAGDTEENIVSFAGELEYDVTPTATAFARWDIVGRDGGDGSVQNVLTVGLRATF